MQQALFELPLPLQPKARPRFSGHAYTSDRYREWMRSARAILAEWWTRPPLGKGEVIALQLTFCGPGTSDLDNLAGAVLDAGRGIIWIDDRVTVIRRIEAEWKQAPRHSQTILLSVIW
jgi:Holliday junction resolvase RusA-like endonuclease